VSIRCRRSYDTRKIITNMSSASLVVVVLMAFATVTYASPLSQYGDNPQQACVDGNMNELRLLFS